MPTDLPNLLSMTRPRWVRRMVWALCLALTLVAGMPATGQQARGAALSSAVMLDLCVASRVASEPSDRQDQQAGSSVPDCSRCALCLLGGVLPPPSFVRNHATEPLGLTQSWVVHRFPEPKPRFGVLAQSRAPPGRLG